MINAPLPLKGPNPAIHPDCILDCPTTRTAICIVLFYALTGYIYKARPNHWQTSPMLLSTWHLQFMLGSAGYSFGDWPLYFIGYDGPVSLCK